MTRHGKPSIVREVKICLRMINKIGHSKREARRRGEKAIHSQKQWEHTLSASQNFVKWCRTNKGVKSISELNLKHYTAYLEHLEKGNRSIGHMRNVETALLLLNEGVKVYFHQIEKGPPTFVPEKRIVDWRELETPKNRSYSLDEYEAILKYLSKETRKAVKLMWHLGLRVKEAANIRAEHFLDVDGTLSLQIQSDEAGGVTKGGRFRFTPVPIDFLSELLEMLADKKSDEKVVGVKYATIRHAVYTACKKAGIEQNRRGCHGFRHAYVRRRLQIEFENAGIAEKAKSMLNRIFENRKQGRLADYGIFTANQKETYHKIRSIMNRVHAEIGHGKDRWDLAEVYMKYDE